jgi:hypothetical protein
VCDTWGSMLKLLLSYKCKIIFPYNIHLVLYVCTYTAEHFCSTTPCTFAVRNSSINDRYAALPRKISHVT